VLVQVNVLRACKVGGCVLLETCVEKPDETNKASAGRGLRSKSLQGMKERGYDTARGLVEISCDWKFVLTCGGGVSIRS
jgi:hypothetical protein